MSNLPPGVTESMIPGNRPEDVAIDKCMEQACEKLPSRFEKILEHMQAVKDATHPNDLLTACSNLVNGFEPTRDEIEGARIIGHHITRKDILEGFLSAIDDVADLAGLWDEYIPEPEREV
jgi:hypothetical protein